MRVPYKRYMTTTFVIGYLWFRNSINLLPILSFLKTTLYPFPSLIWHKVEPPDSSGVIKWLVKSAWFWCTVKWPSARVFCPLALLDLETAYEESRFSIIFPRSRSLADHCNVPLSPLLLLQLSSFLFFFFFLSLNTLYTPPKQYKLLPWLVITLFLLPCDTSRFHSFACGTVQHEYTSHLPPL